MKAQELRDIAARLNRWADELEGIKTEGGAIKVTLPQPDLFSQMGIADEPVMPQVEETLRITVRGEDIIKEAERIDASRVQRRIYKRVGCKMRDEAIVSANKVGRAQGYCQRSDIERSLLRKNPERSREEIREAVNAAVEELGLTCIVFNSYRYYRRSARGLIIAKATAKLCA